MPGYIDFLDSCFTITRDDMPRAASLLPERYRDSSKSPLEQVACALRDCGFTAYTSGGALDALDGEEAGDLDGLALSQGLNEDGLEGGQGLVGLRLGQVGTFGNLSDKLGTVHGH